MTIDEAKVIVAENRPSTKPQAYWQARAILAEANVRRLVEAAGPVAEYAGTKYDEYPTVPISDLRRLAATVKEVAGG